MKAITKKYKLYKQLDVDIWGYHTIQYSRRSKYSRFFVKLYKMSHPRWKWRLRRRRLPRVLKRKVKRYKSRMLLRHPNFVQMPKRLTSEKRRFKIKQRYWQRFGRPKKPFKSLFGKEIIPFIYRLDYVNKYKPRKRKSNSFVSKKVNKLWFRPMKLKFHRRLSWLAAKKEGSWESAFIILVESRLINFLYRLQFHYNFFKLRQYIFDGWVSIASRTVRSIGFVVKPFTIVSFGLQFPGQRDYLRRVIRIRLTRRRSFFNVPRYMLVSYKMMFGVMVFEPKISDLAYPNMFIDIFRALDIHK